MKMIPTLTIVVALGLSFIVLGGLGVSDYFGDEAGSQPLEDEVEDQADQQRNVSPEEGESGGFISFVLSGINEMRSLMAMAVFLPSTLQNLGAPAVVARALGHGTQLVIAVGMVKLAVSNQVE